MFWFVKYCVYLDTEAGEQSLRKRTLSSPQQIQKDPSKCMQHSFVFTFNLGHAVAVGWFM